MFLLSVITHWKGSQPPTERGATPMGVILLLVAASPSYCYLQVYPFDDHYSSYLLLFSAIKMCCGQRNNRGIRSASISVFSPGERYSLVLLLDMKGD
jgi:hypothetical protein